RHDQRELHSRHGLKRLSPWTGRRYLRRPVSKRRFVGKAVVVTGAGSGIGQATAIAFAEEGAELFLCDIDETRLAGTIQAVSGRGVAVHSYGVDVADRRAMSRFADAVHARVPAVDVLVNNAGVGLGATFLETTLEDWEWIISINVWGVIHGCHFFVPEMVRHHKGHVVNVASASGFVTVPELPAYVTTN